MKIASPMEISMYVVAKAWRLRWSPMADGNGRADPVTIFSGNGKSKELVT